MNRRHVLLCYRIADLPDCPPTQSFAAGCKNCGKGIWVALSSPVDNVERWCIQCARDQGLLKRGTFCRLTSKQLAEVRKYFREERR